MGLHKVGTHGRQLICEWGVTYPVLEGRGPVLVERHEDTMGP